jgi:hypothetical protein
VTALLQCGTDAFVCQPARMSWMFDYFGVSSISISRLGTSVRSSGRPTPFCSVFVGQIVNLRRIVSPPGGFDAPPRVRQTLALSLYFGRECQIPNNNVEVTPEGGLTIRRRLTTCPTNARVSFNVESPIPCYGSSRQFHDTNFASSWRRAGIAVTTYAGGKRTLGSEGDST